MEYLKNNHNLQCHYTVPTANSSEKTANVIGLSNPQKLNQPIQQHNSCQDKADNQVAAIVQIKWD